MCFGYYSLLFVILLQAIDQEMAEENRDEGRLRFWVIGIYMYIEMATAKLFSPSPFNVFIVNEKISTRATESKSTNSNKAVYNKTCL